MDPKDITSAMQPLLDMQAQATQRVLERRAWLAKLLLVVATAVFSAFATYTAQRYLASGKVEPMSLVVLALLAASVRNRWRAA
ncbi:hypothetical protein [Lysobacter sp. N42]|jgi:hypothetical protein|uniref:hypothetical protein n=1 Tax=Lysobacter sp. N42 TaxID=2545719 RepID=UPI0010522B3F|nr:hypothetical protein [Lysobacter sp. N42]TCZ78101.1 hypothetical protein EYQ95_25800 [Lysobacter sp. N42]